MIFRFALALIICFVVTPKVWAQEDCEAVEEGVFEYLPFGNSGKKLAKAEGVFGCLDLDLISYLQTNAPRTDTTDRVFAEYLKDPKYKAMALIRNIGDETFLGHPQEAILNHAKSVGRLDIKYGPLSTSSSTEELTSWCTATLISPRHLITAHHCVPGLSPTTHKAVEAIVWFDYFTQDSASTRMFQVDPDPVVSNKVFDFAVLRLADGISIERPYIDISENRLMNIANLSDQEQSLYVFHHPLAQPMRISLDKDCSPFPNKPVTENGKYLKHNCSTFPVSSGSMIISRDFRPVAIHTRGVMGKDADESVSGDDYPNKAVMLTQITKRFGDKPELGLLFNQLRSNDVFTETRTTSGILERAAFTVKLKGSEVKLGSWGRESSTSAYLYVSGLENVEAIGRSSISEFCNVENFNMTVNWGLPLDNGNFGLVKTSDGQVLVVKLIDTNWKPEGETSSVTYQYWVAESQGIVNYSGHLQQADCNEVQFELAKFSTPSVSRTGPTGTDVLYRQSIVMDFDNYRNGHIEIGDREAAFPIKVSGQSRDAVYFYARDLPYEKVFNINNEFFQRLSGDVMRAGLDLADRPQGTPSLVLGETTIVQKENGWIGAITPRKIDYARSIIVFDLAFGSYAFGGFKQIDNPFLACDIEILMTPSCASSFAVPGYVK